jgi:hypothetical protein
MHLAGFDPPLGGFGRWLVGVHVCSRMRGQAINM